jgi:hypothetical protein
MTQRNDTARAGISARTGIFATAATIARSELEATVSNRNRLGQPRAARQYDLEAELQTAVRLAQDRKCAAAVDRLNLRIDVTEWGVGFAEFDGGTYQPTLAGDPAFIVAITDADGVLVDLVACRLSDRSTASRLGVAAILGEGAVESARCDDHTLLLYNDVLGWLHNGCAGAVVLDWESARITLAGLPNIACSSRDLAARLHAALAVPVSMPRLTYARVRHA